MLNLARRVFDWRPDRKCEFNYRLLDRIGSKSLKAWALETTFYDEGTIELGDENHKYCFWEWLAYQRVEFNLQYTDIPPEPTFLPRPILPIREADILDQFRKLVILPIRAYIQDGSLTAEIDPETKEAILSNTFTVEEDLDDMNLPLDQLPLELIRLSRLVFQSVYTEVPKNMREMRAKDKQIALAATKYIGISAGIAREFEEQVTANKEIERQNTLDEETHRTQHAHWLSVVDFLDENDRKLDHLSKLLDRWFAYEPFVPFRLELFSWTAHQQEQMKVYASNPQSVSERTTWPSIQEILSFKVRYSKKDKNRLDHRLYDLIGNQEKATEEVPEDPFVVFTLEEPSYGHTYDEHIREIIRHFDLRLVLNIHHKTHEEADESISELRRHYGIKVNTHPDREKLYGEFETFTQNLLVRGADETVRRNTIVRERNLAILKNIPKWHRLQLISTWL